MNLRKIVGFSLILVISCLFWGSYSVFAVSQMMDNEIPATHIAKAKAGEETNLVFYKLKKTEQGKSIPTDIYLKGEKILTFTQIAGGLTPRERAFILVDKLETFMDAKKNPWKIFPGFENGISVIKYEDEILLTADIKSAKSAGISVSELSLKWTNSLRKAFGVTELINDYKLIKLLAENYDEIVGHTEVGVASWYGGYFHGRTAADGSIYDMDKFTAAHQYLPFGSIVKVTNQINGSSCMVKITDRGPFIGDRIIDLSRVAAKEIGMFHSGVSEVKIEVIGKV